MKAATECYYCAGTGTDPLEDEDCSICEGEGVVCSMCDGPEFGCDCECDDTED